MESIYLEYENEADLYQSYMPFFTQGGLFFRTDELYEMGTELTLHIILPHSIAPSCVKSCVSWITPYGAQNGNDMGVGVSFTEDLDNINHQIQECISRLLATQTPTLSM